MDEYAVIITPDAEYGLNELDDYIMNVKNFAVFYYVLEEYREVYIQNVIYQKRDIPQVLRDLYGNDFT